MKRLAVAFLLVQYAVCNPKEKPVDPNLKPCGDSYYLPDRYTCYDDEFLCPIKGGNPTFRCGNDCYLASNYSCVDGKLSSNYVGVSSGTEKCTEPPTTLHLSDLPYENYFYSDCNSASQVVVTSPLGNSDLTIIGPRLLVAWPAGNSGLVAFFAPQNGVNGSLSIALQNDTDGQPLSGINLPAAENSLTGNRRVGISTLLSFNSSAILTVPIIGSIRNIRDFTEGPSILNPLFQDALRFDTTGAGGVSISRLWLDNKTTSAMSFSAQGDNSAITLQNRDLKFEAGVYNFTAWFDYLQLQQLGAVEVLNAPSRNLIAQDSDQAKSLSFLSYTDKLLAGAWRFLTYFGRDSIISYLLMEPILSRGNGSAAEAVISAVLERINKTDGSVCHEETIGDYSTFLNLQKNITSTAPGCTYPMIDTDYYLVLALDKYFQNPTGKARMDAFLGTTATLDFGNAGLEYSELARLNAEKIIESAAAFAQDGGQIKENLIHLKQGELVGQWRDSTYGIGGGRIPFDVNTALVPAALRSIAALSELGIFPSHPDWAKLATQYAQVWEDSTLSFFAVHVPQATAKQLVGDYSTTTGFGFPSRADDVTSDITYHGLALDGNNNQSIVKVMNTDDCFRHFLVNSTNQGQLTGFLNQTANNILNPYPVGLSNPVGLLVANPAYGGEAVYARNFSNNAYHGTVVWSWQQAMMAAGLERQLDRCNGAEGKPDFCADTMVRVRVTDAYNHLWDVIDDNKAVLSNEVWSWLYRDGNFTFEPLGALPPQDGVNPTESNVRQLWSLTYLAVKRNEALRNVA